MRHETLRYSLSKCSWHNFIVFQHEGNAFVERFHAFAAQGVKGEQPLAGCDGLKGCGHDRLH